MGSSTTRQHTHDCLNCVSLTALSPLVHFLLILNCNMWLRTLLLVVATLSAVQGKQVAVLEPIPLENIQQGRREQRTSICTKSVEYCTVVESSRSTSSLTTAVYLPYYMWHHKSNGRSLLCHPSNAVALSLLVVQHMHCNPLLQPETCQQSS